MRRREISPEFWTDEKVVDLSDAAKLLFIGLWNLADREGRLEDRPRTIGLKVRPWAPMEAASLLVELEEAGLVRRYSVGEQRVLCIPKFAEHQKPHPKEMASKLPPPEASRETPRPAVESNGEPGPAVERERISSFPSGSSGSSFPSGSSGSSFPSGSSGSSGEPPPPADSNFTAEGFFTWAQGLRAELGAVRERPPHPSRLSAWYSHAMSEVGGDDHRLREGWRAYLADPHWRAKRAPWAGWVAQWERYVPPAAAEPAGPPKCCICGAVGGAGTDSVPLCLEHVGQADAWHREGRLAGSLFDAGVLERWVVARELKGAA